MFIKDVTKVKIPKSFSCKKNTIEEICLTEIHKDDAYSYKNTLPEFFLNVKNSTKFYCIVYYTRS